MIRASAAHGRLMTIQAMPSPRRIPLFPLNTVLFPGGVLPLRVFETRYMDMTRECLKSGHPFGVCLIREGAEVGTPAAPVSVGCLAHITDWDMPQLGMLHLTTSGGQCFRILDSRVNSQGLITADIELIPPEPPLPLPDRFSFLAQLLERAFAARERSLLSEQTEFGDAAWVGYRVAEMLPIPHTAKQALLELTDSVARLDMLLRHLGQAGLDGKPEPGE